MFMRIVCVLLMLLLITAGGAAFHMGVFKAHRQETSFVKKALGGVVSYGISTAMWLCMYSWHYLKW